MKKIFILPLLVCANAAFAVDGVVLGGVAKSDDMYGVVVATDATNESSFFEALKRVRKNCSGISEKLNDIKKMAGVGTAVSAVGTVAAGGATAVGVVKSKTDTEIEDIKRLYSDIETASEKVPEDNKYNWPSDIDAQLRKLLGFDVWMGDSYVDKDESALLGAVDAEKQKKELKSKQQGHIRTGLMATATATNIASAVISGTNKIDDDFASKIGACLGAVQLLANTKVQASLDGSATNEEIANANKIISACNKYNIADVEKINSRATGATVASGVGAATGLTGTITSGLANSDKGREDADKAKKLNTVSNVLAGATTVASLTSTVFNATQIAAAKRVIETAEQCEEALK